MLVLSDLAGTSTGSYSIVLNILPVAPLLILTKSVMPNPAVAGSTVNYTLTCQNYGTAASNVTFTDVLPAGLAFAPGSGNNAPVLQNAGFESPAVGNGYVENPTGAGWTFTGDAGVAGNGSEFTVENQAAPEGTQVGFIEDTGEISQAVTFAAGSYVIAFQAAQQGNDNLQAQDFQVLVDGTSYGSFTPIDVRYASYATLPFTVSAGTHTICFQGIDSVGGPISAFIDAVQILPQNAGYWSLGNLNAGAIATINFQATVAADGTAGASVTNTALAYCNEVPNAMISNPVTLTVTYLVTPSAGAHGTISPSTAQTVNYGSSLSLTFTATSNTGYTVNTWSLDGTVVQTGGTNYLLTLTNITANHTVNVTFTPLTYTVTPSAGVNGTISPSTAQTVNYGSSLTFTATPSTGYTEAEWSLDGTVVQTGGLTYTLSNIVANHTVTVTFTVAILSAVSLTTTPTSPQVTCTAIMLTATPTDNGGQVQYLFRVGYTDTAGWHWTSLNGGNYTTTATCTWTPVTTGAYTLVVWARLVGHTADFDAYASLPYQINLPPITAVALAVKPASPQPINTAITLTATPTGGGGQVQYLFRVGYQDAAGWHWSSLNGGNYTTTATCTWTPAAVDAYTLVVWARIIGHTASYDQYASQGYQVTVPPLTAVALAAKPASPQPENTAITLTAMPTGGGGQVQYLFRAGYSDAAGWHWVNINSTYTTTATCTWTPAAVESYTLVVWARLIGHTANYDQYASQGYQVTVPPLTAVALKATPAAAQPVGTPITLTATPTGGGGQVQYLFRVGYSNAAGWHWANINGTYTMTATCTWTPAAVGSYTLVVWARIVGHTANYDVYTSQGYQVIVPPLSAVALTIKPASPQPENTAITLTAIPTGGGGQVPIPLPRGLYGCRGLALVESQRQLYHHGHLHLDAGGSRFLHTGGVGAPHRAYRQL